MIKIYGKPTWPSVARLQNAVSHIDSDLAINWGYTVPGALNERYLNGLQQLEAFNGFPTAFCGRPMFTEDLDTAKLWSRIGYEVWGRKLHHTRGNDIVGRRHRLWRHRDFWVVKVPGVIREWRIHVFKGKAIARALKFQESPPTRRLEVRSRANGWHMRHDVEPSQEIRDFGKAMVAAVGYDFGACDILETESGLVALEVNKAPALGSNYTLAAYVKAIEKEASRLRTISEEIHESWDGSS